MNIASITYQFGPAAFAEPRTPRTSAAAPAPAPTADTVELSTAVAVDAAVDAEPAPVPAPKLTGHARVSLNIQRNVERLIAREAARTDRLIARAGPADAAAIDASRAAFEQTVSDLAASYAADPANAPSGTLGRIREAVEACRASIGSAARAA